MNVYDLHTPDDFSKFAFACAEDLDWADVWPDADDDDEEDGPCLAQLAVRSLKADPEIWNAVTVKVTRALGTMKPAEATDYLVACMKETADNYFWQSLALELVSEIN